MTTKTARPVANEEERRTRRILALVLWNADNKDDMAADPAERKAAYALVKQDYLKKARDLTRRLKNKNLKLLEIEKQA